MPSSSSSKATAATRSWNSFASIPACLQGRYLGVHQTGDETPQGKARRRPRPGCGPASAQICPNWPTATAADATPPAEKCRRKRESLSPRAPDGATHEPPGGSVDSFDHLAIGTPALVRRRHAARRRRRPRVAIATDVCHAPATWCRSARAPARRSRRAAMRQPKRLQRHDLHRARLDDRGSIPLCQRQSADGCVSC